MLHLNARVQGAQPPAEQVGTQARIARIFKAIDELRVELKKLYKELENTSDTGRRMELRHRIDGIEEMIKAMRQQIIALTQLEQRRKAQRHTAAEAGSMAARPATALAGSAAPSGGGLAGEQGGGADPPDASDEYYPPAMQPVSDSCLGAV
jgi:TolA-binding protein